jgi:hypothetical protein
MMWAALFRTSPQFACYHAPPEIMVASEKCLRGDQDPWSRAYRDWRQASNVVYNKSAGPHDEAIEEVQNRSKTRSHQMVATTAVARMVRIRRTMAGMGGLFSIVRSSQFGMAGRGHANRSIGI